MELLGGDNPLASDLSAYKQAWRQIEKQAPALRELAKVNTISWKVADKRTLIQNINQLADNTEQVHIGTVNDRFIASIVLTQPSEDFWIIKILERRTGSQDALGLDSLDYLVENLPELISILRGIPNTKTEEQKNEVHAWVSFRFGPELRFEAKFVDHLVLQVARKELQLSEKVILTHLSRGI